MSTQISTISPQQLHEQKRRGRDAPVLDVRSVAEYRAGHIQVAQLPWSRNTDCTQTASA